MNIYDGGSEKDFHFVAATSNGISEYSDGINYYIENYFEYLRKAHSSRQLYITYRVGSAGPCTTCKGFSAKITFDNICEKGRNIENGKLIVHNFLVGFLPLGSNCQWLISALDDQHYVNLEFETLNVRT